MSNESNQPIYDVIIVGAGPAGLSGALVLGRCRRNVLVLDDGLPRNAAAREVRGFLTCDGMTPDRLRQIARDQLQPYRVTLLEAHVTSAAKEDGLFVLSALGERWKARKLLLATGVRDRWSEIPGVAELAGSSVFQCPYCDGWEVRDRDLGVYAPCAEAADVALGLKTWSARVTLFTGDTVRLGPRDRARLAQHGVRCRDEPIAEVVGALGKLEGVRLVSGELVPVEALFVHAGQEPRNVLAAQLGCRLEPQGTIDAGPKQQSGVAGLFIAGDLAIDVQAVAIAVADGYRAAIAINRELREEDFP
jgi:thioredoxin reductase